LGLIQGRRIIDAWAARLTGNGINHQVRGAHQAVLHRRRGLDRQEFLQQRRIEPAATLGEHLWQHNMRLGALHLDITDPTGIHDRHVGP
jgi:hypothetical protein